MVELTVKRKESTPFISINLRDRISKLRLKTINIKIPKPINKYIPSQDIMSSQANSMFNPKMSD